jgi:hypothetical protein
LLKKKTMIMRLSFCSKKPYNPKIHPPKVECTERERERIHTKYKQMNIMLCARQTLELCGNPSCPNPNNFACELFGGGGCRQYLRKSLPALLADPTTECCTYTLHVWESRQLWNKRPVLSWEWPAIEKQQSSKLVVWMYVCMYYIAWSELTSVFQCIAEHFDEILCSWKKKIIQPCRTSIYEGR